MPQPELIFYCTVTGVEPGATGVIASGINDSNIFTLARDHGVFAVSFVKSSITSFQANMQLLGDDGETWHTVADSSNVPVSFFGTLSASVTRTYPLWIGGSTLPSGVPAKLVIVVTGTPAATDAVRVSYMRPK